MENWGDAWREYAAHYEDYHGPPTGAPNKPVQRGGIGHTDQYADAPIDVPRLVKTAHAHLALAIQGCQSDSKLDEVADRRVLQEALWGLESLISIWSLDSGK